MSIVKELVFRLRGEYTTEKLVKMGLIIGRNFKRMNGVTLDPSHCWLIDIGDNVTLAPRVHVLAHDASTKRALGFTKIGRVRIGNNVFIGASAVVLPGVSIGNNVIIGANSTVTQNIEDGLVVAGSPARKICTTEEYLKKEYERMNKSYIYGEEYTIQGGASQAQKRKQRQDLSDGRIGYVK